MIVASTMEPLFRSSPFLARWALTCLKMSSAKSLASSRWRKFRIVVSSGTDSIPKPANVRRKVISYKASSIAGSLSANQFCIKCTRSIASSG